MLHDRIRMISLFEEISEFAGKRVYSESRLVDLFFRCRQGDRDARNAVLGCHADKQPGSGDAELLECCRADDPASWEYLVSAIEAPLLNELRTQNLIARCLTGNADACVELFRGIEQKAKGLLCFRIYNLTREDVQDLSMMIATRIFRELPRYDARRASFNTFWRLLLDQIYKDYLRMKGAGKRAGRVISIDAGAGHETMEIPAPGPGPAGDTIGREEFHLLHSALERLGDADVRCRRLFELFYFEENTYAEIAVILKMNAKTVSTGLVRCREKVRGFFPEEFREQARQ